MREFSKEAFEGGLSMKEFVDAYRVACAARQTCPSWHAVSQKMIGTPIAKMKCVIRV